MEGPDILDTIDTSLKKNSIDTDATAQRVDAMLGRTASFIPSGKKVPQRFPAYSAPQDPGLVVPVPRPFIANSENSWYPFAEKGSDMQFAGIALAIASITVAASVTVMRKFFRRDS